MLFAGYHSFQYPTGPPVYLKVRLLLAPVGILTAIKPDPLSVQIRKYRFIQVKELTVITPRSEQELEPNLLICISMTPCFVSSRGKNL